MNTTISQPVPDFQTIKARQKATWESGDFGQVAKYITPNDYLEVHARLATGNESK